MAAVRLQHGATDTWELQADGTSRARSPHEHVVGRRAQPAQVEYDVVITGPVDHELQRMLLAVPVAIDILDTQAF